MRESSSGLPRPWSEFLGVVLLAIGVLMLGGLFSYQFGAGTLMGPVGRLVASALYAALGMGLRDDADQLILEGAALAALLRP